MPRGGPRPNSGRPKGSRNKVAKPNLVGLAGSDDAIASVMREVMASDANSPSLRLRAAAALSRHAKSLRQATKRSRTALGATADPAYSPGPFGFLHTYGRPQAEGLEALANHMRDEFNVDEVEPYHPPEWIAQVEYLYGRRLTLSPADQAFVDGMLVRVERRPEPGPAPSTAERERLSSLFQAADGTQAYLDAPEEA